jgi:pimeloyl-ACP methyl ester carboxylesterase
MGRVHRRSRWFNFEHLEERCVLGAGTLPLLDLTGPRVIENSPNGVSGLPVDHVDLMFSEPIDPTTFTAADILTLAGPSGDIAPGGDPMPLDESNTIFRVIFAAQQAPGSLALRLGMEIRDSAGNVMDQDEDGQKGEDGDDEYATTIQLVRTPTLVVPGILGSLTPEIEFKGSTASQPFQVGRIRKELRRFLLKQTAFDPRELVSERLGKAYDEIIDRFENQGFELCMVHRDVPPESDPTCDRDADLFFAAYDWRQPVLVNPSNETQLLWDNDGVLESGVEYLDWWIDLAKAKWVERYGTADGFAVDIVAHSMGGLVSRSYIEEADDAGQVAEPVNQLIMLGTPNHGSVASFQFVKPGVRLFESFNLGCSSVAALVDAVIGADSSDSCLRAIIKEAMPARDKLLKLRRGTSQPLDVVPSLRDLQPTFPFFRPMGATTREMPVTNFLLNRLNAGVSDLTAATDVVLIGTDNRDTPVAIDAVRERSSFTRFRDVSALRFQMRSIGDGRVVFDRIPDVAEPAGLVLDSPEIDVIAVQNVAHGSLARNDRVICLVFEQLGVGPAAGCA